MEYPSNFAATYDSSVHYSSAYPEMVSPPPLASSLQATAKSDVKPTEEELWQFRQRTGSTASSTCCNPPYDCPTPMSTGAPSTETTAASSAAQPSTSQSSDTSTYSSCNLVVLSENHASHPAATKAGRPSRLKREPVSVLLILLR